MVKTLILIGSSTGGPGHLNQILQQLPDDFTASMIIAQHMASPFIPGFIRQLSTLIDHPVLRVEAKTKLDSSTIYVCSGECRLREIEGEIYIESFENNDNLYNPDINTLFFSAARLPTEVKRMGVILTGIGDDGTLGAKELYQSGGYCLFESEKSAVVYGMPRSAAEYVPEADVGSLKEIIEKINLFGMENVRMV